MKTKAIPAAALLVLFGCTVPVKLQMRGVKPLNENERKENTPVDVRIYQLKDNARFDRATIDNLWMKDKETLAEDLAAVKTITVFPAEAQDKPQVVDLGTVDPSIRFIGILALYAKEEEGQPRKVVVPVAEADDVVWEFTGFRIRKGQ
jgi:type VI secretion system VasD/TssJ family lipoprotein